MSFNLSPRLLNIKLRAGFLPTNKKANESKGEKQVNYDTIYASVEWRHLIQITVGFCKVVRAFVVGFTPLWVFETVRPNVLQAIAIHRQSTDHCITPRDIYNYVYIRRKHTYVHVVVCISRYVRTTMSWLWDVHVKSMCTVQVFRMSQGHSKVSRFALRFRT